MTTTRTRKTATKRTPAKAKAKAKPKPKPPSLAPFLAEVSEANQAKITDWIMKRRGLCLEGKIKAIRDLGLPLPTLHASVNGFTFPIPEDITRTVASTYLSDEKRRAIAKAFNKVMSEVTWPEGVTPPKQANYSHVRYYLDEDVD